jgi:malate dehydrogenase (oxaloacetate-decarboxylating)(NADP+)
MPWMVPTVVIMAVIIVALFNAIRPALIIGLAIPFAVIESTANRKRRCRMGHDAKTINDSFSKPFPKGINLLKEGLYNKGMAFTAAEREALGIDGLLPPAIATIETQIARNMENFRKKPSDIEKYIFMMSVLDHNVTLYCRILMEHLEEMMPIIYTPTVGQACLEYSHIFQRPRGVFLSAEKKGRFAELLGQWSENDVRIIVVTDGERILGLGDLGASGMGIPVGKLSLYVACAGILPAYCLPVLIDVGTNNADFLGDPLYIGLKQERLRGEAYDAILEEFISAVELRFPNALIQFEDFGNSNAFRLLDKYRSRVCAFNDDIQGTACVAVAGLMGAARMSGQRLTDQKILFLGAGSAGTGIGELIVAAMMDEGLSESKARERCWFVDSKGLILRGRSGLAAQKQAFAHDFQPVTDFPQALRALKPTAIIGVSGQTGKFTKEILQDMAEFNRRPIIFALSNPTSKAECTAREAYIWTKGQAIFASGSPFDPVTYNGKTFYPGQGNNAYVFPGIGLGVISVKARRVTDEMFLAATKALASQVSESDFEKGRIYPSLKRIWKISLNIATEVAETAFKMNLTRVARPDDMEMFIRNQMVVPAYPSYV